MQPASARLARNRLPALAAARLALEARLTRSGPDLRVYITWLGPIGRSHSLLELEGDAAEVSRV